MNLYCSSVREDQIQPGEKLIKKPKSQSKLIKKHQILLLLFSFIVTFSFTIEYPVPNFPFDITTADIDRDGDIDIIVASGDLGIENDTISVLYNDGVGDFTSNLIANENFHFLECINIDNDIYPDLVTKIMENYSIVYYHNYEGSSLGEYNIIF